MYHDIVRNCKEYFKNGPTLGGQFKLCYTHTKGCIAAVKIYTGQRYHMEKYPNVDQTRSQRGYVASLL